MNKVFTVAQVVVPIFTAIFLGVLARKKAWVTSREISGMQQFVMKIGLPCVVFLSCFTANIGLESLSSMALLLPLIVLSTLWAFHARKKRFPYHNLPQLFSAQESGMLGIPLYMILFGTNEAYRIGVLDLTQAVIAIPVIAILSADAGEKPSAKDITVKVLTSPLMVMSILGLILNVTGVAGWLENLGLGGVIRETASFLSQPVSALMIFSVGFNFTLSKEGRSIVTRVSIIHFVLYAVFCGILQLGLCLIPDVDMLTRWAVALYCALPPSYLASGLGRTEAEHAMAAAVCSVLTITCLMIFCVMAAVIS